MADGVGGSCVVAMHVGRILRWSADRPQKPAVARKHTRVVDRRVPSSPLTPERAGFQPKHLQPSRCAHDHERVAGCVDGDVPGGFRQTDGSNRRLAELCDRDTRAFRRDGDALTSGSRGHACGRMIEVEPPDGSNGKAARQLTCPCGDEPSRSSPIRRTPAASPLARRV
jgi:hypothetical protein